MLVTLVTLGPIASKPRLVLYLPGLGLLSGDYEYYIEGEKLIWLLFSFLKAGFCFTSFPKVDSFPRYYPGAYIDLSAILSYSRYSLNVKFRLMLYLFIFFFLSDLGFLYLVSDNADKILLVGVSWEIMFIFWLLGLQPF